MKMASQFAQSPCGDSLRRLGWEEEQTKRATFILVEDQHNEWFEEE